MSQATATPELTYAARVAARVHGGDLTEDQATGVVDAVLRTLRREEDPSEGTKTTSTAEGDQR
ncbi:hypothetical protein [Corynebacterium sp. AOP12-C2-36]|uniref:hypothetical protein n=1 Tax=Corynebacterium sp. AOP12-C2-36 TaxID=3457723 RepID=UPI0040342459